MASGGGDSAAPPVRPALALVFALIGFVALVIFGLGMASLLTDQDVIAVRGLGQLAGVLGILCAAAAFAAALWTVVRRPHPSYWSALWLAVASALAYLVGVGVGALVDGADPAAALSIVGRIATSWFGAVVLLAGLVSGWSGIALVRTRSSRPRWPWESDDE